MAQKVSVLLVDDVDGGEADETVTFALDGISYEIDLSTNNAAKLREAVARYSGHARRVSSSRGGQGGRRRRGESTSDAGSGAAGPDLAAVRAWARENGHTVSDRGRVSKTVLDAYAASH